MHIDDTTRHIADSSALHILRRTAFLIAFIIMTLGPAYAGETADAPISTNAPRDGVVRSGDTISSMLGDVLGASEIHAFAQACKGVFSLNRLRVGQTYVLTTDASGFRAFRYDIDDWEQLVVERSGDGFAARTVRVPVDVREDTLIGSVSVPNGFSSAVSVAGGDRDLALMVADIFAFRFNAWKDLRPGAAFNILVERKFRRGAFVGFGRVLAATIFTPGTVHEAFWYRSADGRASYYTAEGENLQPYLRAPLESYTLASGYASNRLHPVTRRWQPHYAIDYAAPRGTPVYAACDGEVERITQDRKAGRHIVIRHDGGYETMYLHLNAVAEGLEEGRRVVQGEIIAFVGSTGFATGPHLDFRMRKDGRLVNPRGKRTLSAPPLAQNERRFLRHVVVACRARMGTTSVAMRPMTDTSL
ncbi:murein DD-endopeptidase MepM/ murein hydrolase activator NlpD [Desulfobaculum xiamenense]|uniref:Murein DD-endopeptidase MepM/ murein hydrolase activator NlpD n=1 Tax=Desulfobaculum xiamenense TaxID=995050 RepID=A0A846QTN8_9BACT|nr:M23 family metallopeptidase [Desulfobaculum xiamenense]NJB67999.1 murein DD-endopeptidase MepM/ murein hydrolase activator NlpD [Desulfobaculum xiamenense]